MEKICYWSIPFQFLAIRADTCNNKTPNFLKLPYAFEKMESLQ